MSQLVIVCLGALTLLLAGCSKPPPPETSMPAPLQPLAAKEEAPGPPPDPTAAPTAPVEVAPTMDEETAMITLNTMVSDFGMTRKRPPNGLEELVALKLLPAIPEASPGKKFMLDPKTHRVVLGSK